MAAPLEVDEQYLWTNIQKLVSQLNVSTSRDGRTLRIYEQGQAPCIYGVVVNKIVREKAVAYNIVDGDRDTFWKLVKIGRTAADTTPTKKVTTPEAKNPANRMEVVESEVNKWCFGEDATPEQKEHAMASILIVLRVESGTDDETEEEIRKAMGLLISKKLGKKLGLPVHTEWILTSQPYINFIIKRKKEKQEAGEELTAKLILDKDNASCRFDKAIVLQHPLERLLLRDGTHVDVHIDDNDMVVEKGDVKGAAGGSMKGAAGGSMKGDAIGKPKTVGKSAGKKRED